MIGTLPKTRAVNEWMVCWLGIKSICMTKSHVKNTLST